MPWPCREALKFFSARARPSSPDEYASLLFSGHHGATWSLARFHSRRRARQRPWNLDIVAGSALIEAALHEFETPVVGRPGPTDRRGERALLARGGVERETVGLMDGCGSHRAPRLAAVTTQSARIVGQGGHAFSHRSWSAHHHHGQC